MAAPRATVTIRATKRTLSIDFNADGMTGYPGSIVAVMDGLEVIAREWKNQGADVATAEAKRRGWSVVK